MLSPCCSNSCNRTWRTELNWTWYTIKEGVSSVSTTLYCHTLGIQQLRLYITGYMIVTFVLWTQVEPSDRLYPYYPSPTAITYFPSGILHKLPNKEDCVFGKSPQWKIGHETALSFPPTLQQCMSDRVWWTVCAHRARLAIL